MGDAVGKDVHRATSDRRSDTRQQHAIEARPLHLLPLVSPHGPGLTAAPSDGLIADRGCSAKRLAVPCPGAAVALTGGRRRRAREAREAGDPNYHLP